MSMIIASAILSTVLVAGGSKPTETWTSTPRDPIVLVDTRTYRHCHNDRGRFTICFKKDQEIECNETMSHQDMRTESHRVRKRAITIAANQQRSPTRER